jgi:hypothetical protein
MDAMRYLLLIVLLILALCFGRSENVGPDSTEKGFLMCAGNHMVPHVLKMIWQLKHQWKSSYGISVAHCGEITGQNQNLISAMHPEVKLVNLCSESTVFGMPVAQAYYRLRGFYCKIAAMISSPFPQTMLLDLDVVWFQSPDLLFDSKLYNETGAVFFRDRTYPANANHKLDDQVLLDLFHTKGIGLTDKEVHELTYSNGVSYYWLHIASKLPGGKDIVQLGDLQDSSVVLINRREHPRLLAVMGEMLPTFDYGYGDKEIFWISATISKEPFAFSPLLAGQYGDCHGVILHYHPDDVDNLDKAYPLYTNAEYFVEKDTTAVGDWLGQVMTPPIRAAAVMEVGFDMKTWSAHTRGDRGCTCEHYPCVPSLAPIRQHMLYAQWLTLTMHLSKTSAEKDCVPVKVAAAAELAQVLEKELTSEGCAFTGCPYLPVKVDMLSQTWSASGRYCDPVHFLSTPPTGLDALAAEARRPNSAYNMPPVADNTPIQCDVEKQLFLYQNTTLKPFNSWDAFVSRGFDLDNVVRIPRWQCNNVPAGEGLN